MEMKDVTRLNVKGILGNGENVLTKFHFQPNRRKRTNDKHSKVFCRRHTITRTHSERPDMASRIVHENDKQQRLTAASETVKLKHQMLHVRTADRQRQCLDSVCLPFGHHHLNTKFRSMQMILFHCGADYLNEIDISSG